jgi:TIR domain-containing protein/pentapeptide repeat protein
MERMIGGQQADTMANPEHLAKLSEGVDAWNEWRQRHSETIPDLSGVNLSRTALWKNHPAETLWEPTVPSSNLSRADFRSANLSAANLTYATLMGTRFEAANLTGAILNSANLLSADLAGADLRHADFASANLSGANLKGANLGSAELMSTNLYWARLSESDFSGARIGSTIFADNDLSAVAGLETVWHATPSVIGIDTIYRSKGKIPEVFLRGCGVPDEFITYAKSLVASSIEFYSCFISYSSKDQEFSDRLHADLQNKGVRCWFAPHDIQGGKKLHEQIDEAIRLHDKLLLILSPHSMESEWVKTEIAKARKREVRDQRRVLFPIRLAPFEILRDWECFDADTGKDSAREIREYFIPDFSNWKSHDSYQKAFQRLISDLKAQDSTPK